MITNAQLLAVIAVWAVLTAGVIGLPVWYYTGESWLKAFIDAYDHEGH